MSLFSGVEPGGKGMHHVAMGALPDPARSFSWKICPAQAQSVADSMGQGLAHGAMNPLGQFLLGSHAHLW